MSGVAIAISDNPSVGGSIDTIINTMNQAKRLFFFKVDNFNNRNRSRPVIINGNSNSKPNSEEVINISDK